MAEGVDAKKISEDELIQYRQDLNRFLYSDSEAIFSNYCQEHAKCIIRAFFDAAVDSVVYLSGDFGGGVFCSGPIRNSIVEAVKRGVNVRVISLETSEKSRGCVERLAAELKKSEHPEVKGEFQHIFSRVREGAKVQHYMVVDRKRYRVEEWHPDHQVENVHAEVCCNGKAKAAVLCGMFDDVWYYLKTEQEKLAAAKKTDVPEPVK